MQRLIWSAIRVATVLDVPEVLVGLDMICKPPTVMPLTLVLVPDETVIVAVRGEGMLAFVAEPAR